MYIQIPDDGADLAKVAMPQRPDLSGVNASAEATRAQEIEALSNSFRDKLVATRDPTSAETLRSQVVDELTATFKSKLEQIERTRVEDLNLRFETDRR